MSTSLSLYEMQLVTDSRALLTKSIIIKKVYEFFGKLSEEYKNVLNNKMSGIENFIHPKISRGENYLGLPYVILDFPRQFGKTDVFAIRSFFWWGNFFSITLHLAGQYHRRYAFAVQNAISNQRLKEWYIGTENEWEHHFESNNYLSLSAQADCLVAELPFIKLAKKIPLTKWDETESFFTENFKLLLEILAS